MITGTPTLKKHANGVFYAHWSEAAIGQAAKTRVASLRTKDRAVAKVRFDETIAAKTRSKTTPTVAECWAAYEAKHVRPRVTALASTMRSWALLRPSFGALRGDQVTQEAVDAYVASRPVKPVTIRRELSALVACLNFAKRAKMLGADVETKFVLPGEGKPRDRWLTDAEIARLYGACPRGYHFPHRIAVFLRMALETGGRLQSILDLTWGRVDFETGVIHLDVPSRATTKKRRPSVPMSKNLRDEIEWMRGHEDDFVIAPRATPAQIWREMQAVAIKAGFGAKAPTGISPNVLRHTAATHMARRGVPLWKIAKILGNSMAVVERVYAKHAPDDLRDAVDQISGGRV